MLPLTLGAVRSLLVLGAHPDDIEIGCGGTVLRLAAEGALGEVIWVVCSGRGERRAEAEASADAFLAGAARTRVILADHRDGYFPWVGDRLKDLFEQLKGELRPDLILTHRRADAHQDHRQVAELTWNTWRDHLILEYEIPKYDGDLGNPGLFVALDRPTCERKVELLLKHFPSQSDRRWFTADTFWSLLRLRGIECNAPSGFAEGLYARKVII
ncbi:MAG TPA: PIG-L deacetylase family protein [Actinomycetes bacterium]|nr:PIG-L deacetylase family protein [Actinomycetes bacterium]